MHVDKLKKSTELQTKQSQLPLQNAQVYKRSNINPSNANDSNSSNARAEDWLKERRLQTAPYFLIQLTLVSPRAAQLSYANNVHTSNITTKSFNANEVVVGTEDEQQLVEAQEVLQEIRWSSEYEVNLKAGMDTVESAGDVISTVYHTFKLKKMKPEELKTNNSTVKGSNVTFAGSAKNTKSAGGADIHGNDATQNTLQTEEHEEEDGTVVLDALNKYSIYVDNKKM